MFAYFISTALLLSLLLAGMTNGQVVFSEPRLRPVALDRLTEQMKSNYAKFSLPPLIDNAQLERQEQQERRLKEESTGRRSGYFQFAKAFDVTLTLADGNWVHVDNEVRLWRLAIESKSALSLHLLFDDFELPPGAELYLVSDDAVSGPFTHLNNKEHRQFSVWPVAGNKLILELYCDYESLPSLSISHVVHGYKALEAQGGKGRSGSCNINVACKEGSEWQSESRGVVMMMTNNGQGYCSGSMVNNLAADGRQLFLTAYHCTGRDVSRDAVLFNYEAESCSSSTARGARQSAQGLRKLSSYFGSDFALFEVEEEIPDSYQAYLNGWSAEVDGYIPSQPVGIHHPSADLKKISFSYKNVSETCWGGSCGRRRPEDHWKIAAWSLGTTEPGSSGSPLFDGETKRIVGQLHGGSASCYNKDGYDVYGKLQISYDYGAEGQRMKDFLDPEETGKRYQDGQELSVLRSASGQLPQFLTQLLQ